MKAKKISYIILNESIVFHIVAEGGASGKTYTVYKDDKRYESIVSCIKANDEQALLKLVDVEAIFSELWLGGTFSIDNGAAYFDGERIGGYLESKIIEFAANELPFDFLVNFWKRLRNNPSKNSVNQLYRFLEEAECPITRDGTFIAYKAVKKVDDKLVAYHDRSTEYKINTPVSMKRCDVVDDPSEACGPGLHVGSFKYASEFYSGDSDRVVLEIEVDPADVVSVPTHCNSGKCRCCSFIPRSIMQLPTPYRAPVVLDESSVSSRISIESVVIDSKEYNRRVISKEVFDAINDPTIFASLKPQVLTNTVPSAIVYYGEVKMCFKDLTSNTYYVYHVTENEGDVYAVYVPVVEPVVVPVVEPVVPEAKVKNIAHIEIIPSSAVEKKELVFSGMFYKQTEITKAQYDEFMSKPDTVKVRASKLPAMMKHIVVELCYRNDNTAGGFAQFVVVSGNKLFKFAAA